MTTQEINNQLHRPIQSGSQYDKYFPNSSCVDTKLAQGNTKVAITEMAKWSKKYADHCKDIAPVLQGDDLETTVNNIQDFLYNHFQYSIDGELQNLKSPACAWSTRQQGMDCKSYSIFASCILLKLGIKHYLRRIKQEVMADAYTHVYVVIPEDQNKAKLKDGYFIIDGTIPYNDELPFTAKDDIFMHEPALAIHGLAAPQLGCGTCQSTPSQLGNVSNVAYNGFQDYLDWLVANGVSDHVVDNIEQTVNFYLSQGVDPSFVPSKTGVKINNVYFDYGVPHKALGSTQSQEIDYSTIFNTVSNTSYFNNTFGAIFANGFDVTCWGSSNSPSQTKTEVPVDANYYLNQSGLRLVVNQDNLNKFALMTTAYIKARDMDRNDNNVANCTKKSGEVGYQLMKKFRDDVINGIKNKLQQAGVQVETTIVSQLVHVPAPSGFFDGIIHLNNVQVPVYTFSEAYEDTGLDNNVGIDDGGFYGNDRLDDDPSTAGGFGMFLLVAAAAGAVVYRKKLFGSK